MKPFILPTLLVVISIATFVWFIDPQYGDWQTYHAQASTLDGTLDQTSTLDSVWQGIVAKSNGITADETQALNVMVPDSISTVRLITELNSIAARHGVSLSAIGIADSSDSSDQAVGFIGPDNSLYGTLGISFSFTASYQNFLGFLSDLEHSLTIIDVTSLSLVPAPSTSSTVNGVTVVVPSSLYTYTIGAQTYWLK